MISVSGPGHGGPAVVSNTYLEGTYSEIYPNISQDETGLRTRPKSRPYARNQRNVMFAAQWYARRPS
jgi:XFP N-terminal domain